MGAQSTLLLRSSDFLTRRRAAGTPRPSSDGIGPGALGAIMEASTSAGGLIIEAVREHERFASGHVWCDIGAIGVALYMSGTRIMMTCPCEPPLLRL